MEAQKGELQSEKTALGEKGKEKVCFARGFGIGRSLKIVLVYRIQYTIKREQVIINHVPHEIHKKRNNSSWLVAGSE
jgi:hypothetical protein